MFIFGDIINDQEMMENSQRAINLYRQQTEAKRFFTTEDGEVKPYGQNLEEVFQDEDKLSAFLDWGQGALGNAVVSWLPMIVLGTAAGAVGGVHAPWLIVPVEEAPTNWGEACLSARLAANVNKLWLCASVTESKEWRYLAIERPPSDSRWTNPVKH